MKGFFPSTAFVKAPEPLLPQCGACGLHKTCRDPKVPVRGLGKRKILIIGEFPGDGRDESTRTLSNTLQKFGVDLYEDCWLTYSIICRPTDDHTPTDDEIGYCRPNLTKALDEYCPDLVIPLGGSAIKALLLPIWRDDIGYAVERWAGWQVPCQKPNMWICPTYHPAHLLWKDKAVLITRRFEQHIGAACNLGSPEFGNPWVRLPEFEKHITCIQNPEVASRAIREMMQRADSPIAFDYETNMLKPDSENATIVSCALSNGELTIAYPWHGSAITATQEFLKSDIPKIAANLMFEERWTLATFGHGVNNWFHDTMQWAHVEDFRKGICGLEFQSFVKLGMPQYSGRVKHLFESEGSNEPNNWKKIPIEDLLLYNGLDALLEWKLAHLHLAQE